MPEAYFSRTPELAFRDFKDHVNGLLSKLLTDVPLTQAVVGDITATMAFRKTDGEPCVEVGRGYYLFLGQTLRAKREGKNQYRLQTLAYAYRIAEGPRREDPYVIRWEYNSRELIEGKGLHPRHHCHLPLTLKCFGARTLSLDKLHIASGWVTIEEVLRFLIHELGVHSRTKKWDNLLQASEHTFKLRTARSI